MVSREAIRQDSSVEGRRGRGKGLGVEAYLSLFSPRQVVTPRQFPEQLPTDLCLLPEELEAVPVVLNLLHSDARERPDVLRPRQLRLPNLL
jgi:hypothetical protein